MAEEIIPVTELASQGVVIDTPPVALPSNAFTNVKNKYDTNADTDTKQQHQHQDQYQYRYQY